MSSSYRNSSYLEQAYDQRPSHYMDGHSSDTSDNDNTIDDNVCSFCKNTLTIYDAETGEILCTNCGVVIQDSIETLEPESSVFSGRTPTQKNYKNIRTGTPTSLAYHDMGLSTLISYSNVDANGSAISPDQISKVQRMRHWNKISSYNNRSYARNLKNAFAMMSKIKDKLSLTDPVIEKAAYNYRKALAKQLIKGRSIEGVVVASIYAACREVSLPRKLDELAAAANSDPVFAGKCYRLLLRHLKIQNLPIMDSSIYLSKIANRASVNQKTYRKALEILAAIKENPVSFGKDPNALAVAVLYAACIEEGERVSQAQIAVAGDTSIVTLRKRFADVKKALISL